MSHKTLSDFTRHNGVMRMLRSDNAHGSAGSMLGRRCLSGSKHCSLNLCQCTDVRIIAIFIVCVQTSLVAGTDVGCGTSRPNAMEREDVVHLVIELVSNVRHRKATSRKNVFEINEVACLLRRCCCQNGYLRKGCSKLSVGHRLHRLHCHFLRR